MNEKILFWLDVVFAFFGAFWAGLTIIRALSMDFDIFGWILLFGVIAVLLYPLIRKTVEFLPVFESSYRDRAKERWRY